MPRWAQRARIEALMGELGPYTTPKDVQERLKPTEEEKQILRQANIRGVVVMVLVSLLVFLYYLWID